MADLIKLIFSLVLDLFDALANRAAALGTETPLRDGFAVRSASAQGGGSHARLSRVRTGSLNGALRK
jgi:hypothetical protein